MARVDFTPQERARLDFGQLTQHLVRLVAATDIEVAAMDIRRSDIAVRVSFTRLATHPRYE